jgi:hypothetical protein
LLGPLSNWIDRIHPRDRPPADKLLPTSVGTSTELHCRVSAPDGDWMIRRHNATRVAQDDLHILVWESAETTVGPDATEISEELQKFEKRYQAVFEASLDPLLLIDDDGHLLEVSQGVRDILGWEPHEALGDHFGDYMRDEDMPKMLELWKRVVAGESLRAQVDLVHRDGAEIPTENSATHVELDGATHVVAVLRDLRETMELRSALDKVEKRLARAEKLELVGQLAGGIAHDIQNMLAVITGSARMLKDEATNDTLRGDAEAILAASKTASRLSRQLLEFGTPSTDTPRVYLDELLDSLEPLFSRLLPKTVRLDVDIEPDLPALDMRSIELEQLLVNLLINAADAVGSSGHIRLRANATESPEYGVELEITDDGVGMTPSIRDRVFEPLYTTKGARGTGLGLSTVARIITKVGGTKHVEATPGEGASFRFELPVAEEPDEVDADAAPDALDGAAPRHVLAVDDIPSALRYVTRVIESQNWSVTTASSVDEALAHLNGEHEFDLIVTDYHMSGRTGLDLLEQAHEVDPDLPVVFVTSNQFFDAPDTVAGVVFKPYAPSDLLKIIADALGR